jgi:hypothetical protein
VRRHISHLPLWLFVVLLFKVGTMPLHDKNIEGSGTIVFLMTRFGTPLIARRQVGFGTLGLEDSSINECDLRNLETWLLSSASQILLSVSDSLKWKMLVDSQLSCSSQL